MDQHYNPQINQRLRTIFDTSDWESLITYLTSLSNAQFRTAGYMIGERFAPALDGHAFWQLMRRLVLWQPKAFTVTMAKAAAKRLQAGTLSTNDEDFVILAQDLQGEAHTIDRQKLLLQWLPIMQQPLTMESLFALLDIDSPTRRIDFLLRTEGQVAAFVLLRTMRFVEHDRELLSHVCRQLMKRGDSLSFNLASLLRSYFDLQDIKGTFSLQLQPYELSRLDTDFDTFCRTLRKV